jgi:hypothetical protein
MELSCLTLSLNTGIGPQSQWSPLAARDFDLGSTSESRGSSLSAVPGGFPVPTVRGDTSERKTSLVADNDDGAPSKPQDLADSTLGGLGHPAEYFVVLAIPALRN